MEEINLNEPNHLPGEPRCEVDCTLAVAHGWPVHVPDGTGISHIPVGRVATPWNRTTIPRRCALPLATANAHSTPPNRGF